MSVNTSKSILLTPGSGNSINSSVSQMDFKWYNSGVGTFYYKPNANDIRSSVYNWFESGEPVLLFGGAGTSSNGVQYVASPYIDYVDSFTGVNTSPFIKLFPITGKFQTKDLNVTRSIFDNSGNPGLNNQFLISTASGVSWTALVPVSPIEVSAGATVVDYTYPVGDIRRYGPPNESALLSLLKVSEQGVTGVIPRGVTVTCNAWTTYTSNSFISLEGGGTIIGPSTTFINLRGSANIQGIAFSSWSRVLNNTRGLGYVTSLSISGCSFYSIGNNSIDFEAPFDSVLITNSRWDNCKNYCIRLGFNSYLFQDTWQKMVISDNIFTNITATAPSISCNAMIVYGKEATITGNVINGVTGVGDGIGECHGIYTKARQSVIDSNVVQNITGLSTSRSSGRIVAINNKGNSRDFTDAPQGFNNIISNNFVQNSEGYGIRAQCDEVIIVGNIVEDVTSFAFSIDAFGDNINCLGNKAYNSIPGSSIGYLVSWGTSTNVSSNIVVSNNIAENYNECVRVTVTSGSTVKNVCVLDNLLSPASSGTGIRLNLTTSVLDGAIIRGNTITSGNNGIQMPSVTFSPVLTGLVIQDNNFTGITGNRINGVIPANTVIRSNDLLGRSGYGTAAPTETLHVNGTFRLSGAFYATNNSPGISGQILSSTGAGVTWITQSSIGSGSTNVVPKWATANTLTNSIITDTGTNVSVSGTAAITGSTGIGTSSAAASRLTVLSSSTSSEFAARFFSPSSATPIFAVQNNNTVTSNGTFVAQNSATSSATVVSRVESGVGTNFAVRADGSVLIGAIATPAARLQVRTAADTAATIGLRLENSGGTEVFNVNALGNIRVGAGAPAAQLHVSNGFSASSWTVNGVGLRFAAQTYTDTSTADGASVNANYVHAIASPTMVAQNATSGAGVTYITAPSLFVAPPTAGANTFIRSPYAIYAGGNTRTDGNVFVGDNANYNTVIANNLVSTNLHKGIQIRTNAQNVPTLEFLTAATTTADGDVASDISTWVGTTTLRRVARIRANFVGTNENQASMTFSTMNSGTETDRMMITHDGVVRVGSSATNAPFIVNANGSWGFTTAVTPNAGWSASAFSTLKTLTGASTTGDVVNVLCTLINVLQQHGIIRS